MGKDAVKNKKANVTRRLVLFKHTQSSTRWGFTKGVSLRDRSRRILLFLYDTRSRRRFYFLALTHTHTHTHMNSSHTASQSQRERESSECTGWDGVGGSSCVVMVDLYYPRRDLLLLFHPPLPFSLTLLAQSCVIYCTLFQFLLRINDGTDRVMSLLFDSQSTPVLYHISYLYFLSYLKTHI